LVGVSDLYKLFLVAGQIFFALELCGEVFLLDGVVGIIVGVFVVGAVAVFFGVFIMSTLRWLGTGNARKTFRASVGGVP
jgi:hypothetical protein